MMKQSAQEKYWRGHLKHFIEFDTGDYEGAGEVFVPREHLGIAFLFEGGFRIAGDREALQINFNSPGMLILWHHTDEVDSVYRIPWSRLVGFELLTRRKLTRRKHQPIEHKAPNLILFPRKDKRT